jgi:transcriptional regulator with XRE-family HTH domain
MRHADAERSGVLTARNADTLKSEFQRW